MIALADDSPYQRATGQGEYLAPTEVASAPQIVPTAADISYAVAGSTAKEAVDMKLDVYVPSGFLGPRPVMLWFHGGGGLKATDHIAPVVRELYFRGFIIVSVNYSGSLNSRGLPFSTPITQAKRAVRFVKKLAGLSPVYDASRIFVAGLSAGGHLASMVGLTPGLFEPTDPDVADVNSTVSGVVDFQAAVDIQQMMEWANSRYFDAIGLPHHPFLSEVTVVVSAMNEMFGCRLPNQIGSLLPLCDSPMKADLIQELSPITYARSGPSDVKFLVITGTDDMVVQSDPQGRAFSEALKERAGASTVLWGDAVGGRHGMNTAAPMADQFTGSSRASVNMSILLSFLGCARPTSGPTISC